MPGELLTNGSMSTDPTDLVFTADSEFAKLYSAAKKKLGASVKKLAQSSAAERIKILGALSDGGFDVKAHGSIKDEAKALEFKEMGNQKFRENNFGEAFKFYTQAIQHCPVNLENPEDPANKQYSIIWGNRSAALDGVGLYGACIHDVQMALKFGYPRELWYKLYKRKGHAHIKMKQYLLAREALETSLKNVGRSDIKKEKDRDNYRMRVRKQMTIFNVTKTLYNLEVYEKFDSELADGQPEDRGLSSKLKFNEDGKDHGQIVADKEIFQEENLAAIDPYVAVVNVTGGRAGGKICPFSLEKMFSPVPCRFGSEETFENEKARDEAAESYHKYEWSILKNLSTQGLQEKARLALRMVTLIDPEDAPAVAKLINTQEVPEDRLKMAVETFRLPIDNISEEEETLASVLGYYLLRNLSVSGYVPSPAAQTDVYQLLVRAILVAMRHISGIQLINMPADKKGILEADVQTDFCGYGIYPQLFKIKKYGSGEKSHVIQWFSTKKMVFTSYRKIEKDSPVILFTDEKKLSEAKAKPSDLITFRCGNDLCQNYFPLKENTKEKVVTCPLDECGLKTNIWDRLRQIQKLKKDFVSGKEQLDKGDVGLARDIFKDVIEEWDRMILRPYRELMSVEDAYVKTLICERGDRERLLFEGNQMGKIVNTKKPVNVMEPNPEENEEKTISKMIEIKK